MLPHITAADVDRLRYGPAIQPGQGTAALEVVLSPKHHGQSPGAARHPP